MIAAKKMAQEKVAKQSPSLGLRAVIVGLMPSNISADRRVSGRRKLQNIKPNEYPVTTKPRYLSCMTTSGIYQIGQLDLNLNCAQAVSAAYGAGHATDTTAVGMP
jgi:hypothetical protein